MGRGHSPRHNKCFRGSEGNLSELVHTKEVTIRLSPYPFENFVHTKEVTIRLSPYPFENFGSQLQQLSRAWGLRDKNPLH